MALTLCCFSGKIAIEANESELAGLLSTFSWGNLLLLSTIQAISF